MGKFLLILSFALVMSWISVSILGSILVKPIITLGGFAITGVLVIFVMSMIGGHRLAGKR